MAARIITIRLTQCKKRLRDNRRIFARRFIGIVTSDSARITSFRSYSISVFTHMIIRRFPTSLIGFLFIAMPTLAAERVDYNRDVKPILAKNCFACHGPDETHREAKLRLDVRDDAVTKRKSGLAIDPKNPQASRLLKRVKDSDDPMPPEETGNALTKEQIRTLEKWIEQGAEYAPHWSFVKPKRAEVPKVDSPMVNPIDAIIRLELKERGMTFSPEADRHILIRRLSLDLRGLPPTPEEVRAFVADTSNEAYSKLIDKFMADSAYGERMARPWLDLARYADSAGYGSDPLRPNIWKYRDWVIDAYNKNVPFDRFTREQLAGDLLPDATMEQRVATAFHRNTMTNTEGGTDREEFRVAAVKDRVDTTMQVWMGLTVGCAKCHTHKYDPITQTEYYRAYAIFNQTADNDQPSETPVMPVASAESIAKAKVIDDRIAAIQKEMNAETPERKAAREEWEKTRKKKDAKEAKKKVDDQFMAESDYFKHGRDEIAKLKKERPEITMLPIMQELAGDKNRKTKLMIKGDFLNPGDEVSPGLPAQFANIPVGKEMNRLTLADWIVHPDNPLTARVAVNRLWGQVFGRGLVETEEDFGTQGELPTHPELLDWLATEFIRLKWDTKAFLKLILTSDTYRQSSKVTAEQIEKDPKNIYLGRSPRYRLEAEMIRDQALELSGLLKRKVGGPSVYPPQPDGLWQAAFNGQRTYPTSTGDDKYRRGLYTFWRRTVPYPSMTTFDAPSRETCTIRRIRTNTPLQAFVTLNDPVYIEAAQALAKRIVGEGKSSMKFAYELTTSRPATDEIIQPLQKLIEAEKARFEKDPESAKKLASDANLAAWTVIANVLLNQDAVLTRN